MQRVLELRLQRKSFREIGEALGISDQRARQLHKTASRLNKEQYRGVALPPAVKLAMDRGGFKRPEDVRHAILDGSFHVIGKAAAQTTVAGIGFSKFSEICAFFEIDEKALPHLVPVELRIAESLRRGEPVDEALAVLIGNNSGVRKVAKAVARLTSHLTPGELKCFQVWGQS